MDRLTHLRTFLVVVDCAGFSEAARHLGVVPSVVAKRIAQLEDAVGGRLFERTTRTVTLTAVGERLQSRAAALVAEFDDLVSTVHRDADSLDGHLRLMLPTTLTLLYLGDVVAGFMAEHPRVTLDISLADRSTNPAEQAFDLVVSGRTAHFEGVTQTLLAPIDYRLCASPEYLARHGTPEQPHDLARHRCLVFKPAGSRWTFDSAQGPLQVEVAPALQGDDVHTLLLAAQQGLGLAVLPGYLARAPLARGELQALLPDFPVARAWFRAHVPRRLERHALVRRLCERLKSALQALPQASIRSPGTLPRTIGS